MKPTDGFAEAEAEALREPHISIHVLTKEEADAEDAARITKELYSAGAPGHSKKEEI